MTSTDLLRRTELDSGVVVVTELVPGFTSVALGVIVDAGSRDESPAERGAAHFLEHLAYRRSGADRGSRFLRPIERVGGEMFASTSREQTSYLARVDATATDPALDTLLAMVIETEVSADSVAAERDVVIAELRGKLDDTIFTGIEALERGLYASHPLAASPGGTIDDVAALDPATLGAFRERMYRPHRTVIVAAGQVDHDALCARVESQFSGVGARAQRRAANSSSAWGIPATAVARPTAQTHVFVGSPAIAAADPRHATLVLANALLGGGRFGYLTQASRESGIAYSAVSFLTAYSDRGHWGRYLACGHDRAGEAIEFLGSSLDTLGQRRIAPSTLDDVVAATLGRARLGYESSMTRMQRLASTEFSSGGLRSIDESEARLRAVTVDDIYAVLEDLAARPQSVVVIGPDADALTTHLSL